MRMIIITPLTGFPLPPVSLHHLFDAFRCSTTTVCEHIIRRQALLAAVLLLASPWMAWAQTTQSAQPAATLQTLVFIRHAEKPAPGLGQLNCQGLNRALALPAVLLAKFGKPDFVFASDPHEKKIDGDQLYNYVRPLLTVAPTAVQAGLPVNTSFGFENIEGLQQEFATPRYQNAVVLVAWEHKKLEAMVKAMLGDMGGQPGAVPRWRGSDFDSIYVVTVRRSNGKAVASFRHEQQQLNGQAGACPAAPAAPAAKP
jgi:hypothetical protein